MSNQFQFSHLAFWKALQSIQKTLSEIQQQLKQQGVLIMADNQATTDLKNADLVLGKAITDAVAALQAAAATVSGGVSAADAETVVADLNAKAAALEAAATPAPVPAAPSA